MFNNNMGMSMPQAMNINTGNDIFNTMGTVLQQVCAACVSRGYNPEIINRVAATFNQNINTFYQQLAQFVARNGGNFDMNVLGNFITQVVNHLYSQFTNNGNSGYGYGNPIAQPPMMGNPNALMNTGIMPPPTQFNQMPQQQSGYGGIRIPDTKKTEENMLGMPKEQLAKIPDPKPSVPNQQKTNVNGVMNMVKDYVQKNPEYKFPDIRQQVMELSPFKHLTRENSTIVKPGKTDVLTFSDGSKTIVSELNVYPIVRDFDEAESIVRNVMDYNKQHNFAIIVHYYQHMCVEADPKELDRVFANMRTKVLEGNFFGSIDILMDSKINAKTVNILIDTILKEARANIRMYSRLPGFGKANLCFNDLEDVRAIFKYEGRTAYLDTLRENGLYNVVIERALQNAVLSIVSDHGYGSPKDSINVSSVIGSNQIQTLLSVDKIANSFIGDNLGRDYFVMPEDIRAEFKESVLDTNAVFYIHRIAILTDLFPEAFQVNFPRFIDTATDDLESVLCHAIMIIQSRYDRYVPITVRVVDDEKIKKLKLDNYEFSMGLSYPIVDKPSGDKKHCVILAEK